MASNRWDVAIVGLGAMGSAAAYALARRGQRVIGFDRFTPPHSFGSSHGESRIIREAYFEQPLYVPLVRRAYALWREIEQEIAQEVEQVARKGGQTRESRLLLACGGISVGPADGVIVSGARASARMHGVPYEELSATDVRQRFPAWRVPEDMVGLWDPGAGVLFPERCIDALLTLAAARGATLAYEEPVTSWRVVADGVEVRTAKGVYHAGQLVLAAGGWMRELTADGDEDRERGLALKLPLAVERNAVHWFAPAARPETFRPDQFPLFLLESAADRVAYGFPDLGSGVKVAWHHQGEITSTAAVRRSVEAGEIDSVRDVLQRFLPDASGPCLASAVCLYTNTPDYDFILDRHPRHAQVLIASPCSGHGFKFATAIGEILADLAIEGRTDFDLTPFRLTRFAGPGPGAGSGADAGAGD